MAKILMLPADILDTEGHQKVIMAAGIYSTHMIVM
jgi:hypothetical protein